MEILSNFSSTYCFISFILGAIFMLTTFCIAAMGKVKEPRNNVHFYVARDKDGELHLYMGEPVRAICSFFPCSHSEVLISTKYFSKYGLNENDYKDLKWEDEPVEVFINMED